MELTEIIANKGLGTIKFGMNRSEVLTILSDPDEKESDGLEVGEEYSVEAWHYDELGLSLQFDEEHDWKLVTMAISESAYTIEGEHVIGMNRLELINTLDKLNFGEVVIEDDEANDDDNFLVVCALEENMNFWLESDEVSEIQWGPEYDEEKEQVIWP